MEFKKVFSWLSDDKPETTEAVIYASRCGIIKCGSYKMWSNKNQSYSVRKERVYTPYYNRGKQVYETDERKAKHGKGYQSISIHGKTYAVHRLVALAWIPNPEGKPQVNHKNGIRDDNMVDNLEWVTNLENRRHSGDFLDRKVRKGCDVNTAKLTEEEVAEIKKLISEGEIYLKDIAKMHGVAKSTISYIKAGGWKHV